MIKISLKSAQQVDWDFILDTIEAEKCVLLLGPEIALTPDGSPIYKAMIEELDVDNNEHILAFYDSEDFFLFKDAIAKTRVYYKMKKFYQQSLQEDRYRKLAQIPFHLILNISPDLYLKNMFDHYKFNHQFDFFRKKRSEVDILTPSKQFPLIYNLFGTMNEEESLILTHDDLFDFLMIVLGRKGLPNELVNTLKGADNFIFLGFKFEKWYIQLLLRLLNLHNEKYKFSRLASGRNYSPEVQSLCKDQFKIEFIDRNIDEFIETLLQKCEAKNMIREIGDARTMMSEVLEEYIEKDRIKEAIDLLKDFFAGKDDDLFNEIIGHSSRYNRLNRKINLHAIDPHEAENQINKIKFALLDLKDELKEFE